MIIQFFLKLFYVVLKNLKIVFRTWTSLFLLIIGPLLLILLVGFAFSENTLQGVKMGVYSKDAQSVQSVLDSLESGGDLVYYNDPLICIEDIKLGYVHICLEFSDDFMITRGEDQKDVPTGTITYYYDNSRAQVSNAMLDFVKARIGLASEQITLQATTQILTDIEDSVVYMRAAKRDVKEMQSEGEEMRKELYTLKSELEQIDRSFTPKYQAIKTSQSQMNSNQYAISSMQTEIKNEILSVNSQVDTIQSSLNSVEWMLDSAIDDIEEMDDAIENMDDALYMALLAYGISDFHSSLNTNELYQMKNEIDHLQKLLPTLSNDLDDMYGEVDDAASTMNSLISQFNSLVYELDNINDYLDRAVEQSDESIERMDNGLDALDEMSTTLTENIDKFAGLDSDQASTLVRPITSKFKPLFLDKRFIDLLFPTLLPIIVIFISILLANIVVLSEKNSPAYFRNFIMPVNSFIFVLGIFITTIIIIGFQMTVLFLVAQSRFSIDVFGSIVPITICVTLMVTIFTLLGMIIAYLLESEQTSILVSTFTALCLFLLSDVVFPLESMPTIAAQLARLNPLVLSEALFRKVLLFNLDISYSMDSVGTLGLYVGILGVILIGTYFFSKKGL